MQPPAVPNQRSSVGEASGNSSISPVTPASIMNLGRLGLSSGLGSNGGEGSNSTSTKEKGKIPAKLKNATPSATSTRNQKKTGTSVPMISPGLKPLLPGGIPPDSATRLERYSNYTHHMSGSASTLNISPTTPLPQPTLQVRKTSHKAAEQKRRDSLKTSFDALRLLLPPIPLPTDENYDGSPPLPGAMPPRGPPRGEIQGPNRAVSKLQLLRCGNDYIRQLVARVERRDDYISSMKDEIRSLRKALESVKIDDMEEIPTVDLDQDIDAIEADAPRLGAIAEAEEAEEDGDS